MPDDQNNESGSDRTPIDAAAFAAKHGISIEQAELLIEAHGDDPQALELSAQSIGGP